MANIIGCNFSSVSPANYAGIFTQLTDLQNHTGHVRLNIQDVQNSGATANGLLLLEGFQESRRRHCLWRWASQPFQHELDGGEINPGLAGEGIDFVVLAVAAVPAIPPEAAFHRPPLWEHLEALLVGRTFHDLQVEAVALLGPVDQVAA